MRFELLGAAAGSTWSPVSWRAPVDRRRRLDGVVAPLGSSRSRWELTVLAARSCSRRRTRLGAGIWTRVCARRGRPGRPDSGPAAARRSSRTADCTAFGERFRRDDEMRSGISSGRVVFGSLGGGGRMEFAVIGDPRNRAARVQPITRDTGHVILCTDATRRLLADAGVTLDSRGTFELKGIAGPVPVTLSMPPWTTRNPPRRPLKPMRRSAEKDISGPLPPPA